MLAAPTQKLASSLSYFTSRYAPAIITLLVLSAGFYFYFNVVVSDNEADLKQRNFRGLHRMATNIAAKIDDYAERNAVNFLEALSPRSNKSLPQQSKQIKVDSTLLVQARLAADYDLKDTVLSAENDTLQKFSIKFFNEWNFLFTPKNDTSAAYVSAKNFTSLLLRRDLFPYYLVASGDAILFDELNISHQKLSEFLPGDYARDSVKKGLIQSGESRQVNIGGKAYKLFLLPFVVRGNKQFTIGGYMLLENYISEQRYIPTYAILWMVIGLMVVILMFPLLKVFLMHRSEQLLVSNAISSLASLHVIAAIIVLIVMSSYVYFNLILPAADSNLTKLAESTGSNFTTELDAALREIDSSKTVVKDERDWKDSIISLQNLRDPVYTNQRIRKGSDYKPGSVYSYFKHIAWVDASGQQRYRWTTNSYIPKKINVSGRDYFKAVKSGNLWLRNGRMYYLTGVSSWVSNEKLAVISAPFFAGDTASKKATGLIMVSLSAPFRSMFNALVPEGYGFCIVKDNGDVLFHIDENRSLNENLVEECNDNGSLQSLLRTRSPGFSSSRYSGSSQRFYIQPIPGTPYSVVTYRDMRRIWSEDLDVISACSILCLMNLAVILIAILIIQASGYKRSLLYSQSILFTWLRPNRSLKYEYRSVSIFYWCSMIIQSLFFIFYDEKDQLCLVGISFSYSYILLSYAYFQFTVLNNKDAGRKQQNKKPLYFLAGVYVFVAIVFSINLNSGHLMFAVSQLSLLGIAWLFARKEFLENVMMNQKNFRWWYVLSVFSFIAATAIIPLVNFYLLSFKEERLLSLKRSQVEFAAKFMQQPRDPFSPNPDSIRFSYNAPFYFENFADKITRLRLMPHADNTFGNGFERLYKKIKPAFSTHSREIEFLIRRKDTAAKDFHWLYMPGGDKVQLLYKIPKTQSYFDGLGLSVYSTLTSEAENTKAAFKRDWISFLLMIGSLVVFLWGFNFLLRRLIEKIFFEGYDNSSHLCESDLPFIESLPKDENIFINGPVNSGKSRQLKKYCSDNGIRVLEVDLVELFSNTPGDIEKKLLYKDSKEQEANNKSIVLLRHFELFMNDLSVTEKKLILFESLLHLKKQIIVLSSRSFDSMRIKEIKKEPAESKDFTDRWSNVMNQFYNLYHRWKRPITEASDSEKEQAKTELTKAGISRITETFETNSNLTVAESVGALVANVIRKANNLPPKSVGDPEVAAYFEDQLTEFLKRVDDECAHSDFLWSLRSTLFTYIKDRKKEFMNFDFQNQKVPHMRKVIARHFTVLDEQICLKIQALAANYYQAVWQSMNRDEQRTLYDIALDDMVNPGNRDIASRLANLGLVKRMPDVACYEVMNTSFRNFIFTQLDKKEVVSLRADAAEKGSWNNFQLPVLIVVIAIGIFLFVTQQDSFTNLITYLGGAAGGILALLKVLGMIPSNKS